MFLSIPLLSTRVHDFRHVQPVALPSFVSWMTVPVAQYDRVTSQSRSLYTPGPYTIAQFLP